MIYDTSALLCRVRIELCEAGKEGRKEPNKKPGAGSRSFVSRRGQRGAGCFFSLNESHFVLPSRRQSQTVSGSKPDCGGRSLCGRERGVEGRERRGEERGGDERRGVEEERTKDREAASGGEPRAA